PYVVENRQDCAPCPVLSLKLRRDTQHERAWLRQDQIAIIGIATDRSPIRRIGHILDTGPERHGHTGNLALIAGPQIPTHPTWHITLPPAPAVSVDPDRRLHGISIPAS